MKKIAIVGLFLIAFGLASTSAETWEHFIQRVETMEYNVNEGMRKGHPTTWGMDKWGAVLAAYEWLEYGYKNIYENAPNLTDQQRQTYGMIYRRRITMYQDMAKIRILIHNGNENTWNRTTERWTYWFDFLQNGGTITF